ncbi:hypothetical protein ACOSQ2_003465 [Xanthoceras sorbifolium]
MASSIRAAAVLSSFDKGKGVALSSSDKSSVHSSMDTTPPIRKPLWKRHARTSNDSRFVEMEDLSSHKKATSFGDELGPTWWGHQFKFESCWADSEDCRAIIQRSWAGMADGPLRLVVPSKLRQCTVSLDAWNRSSLQHLRREIGRTCGLIHALGLRVTASSWRALQLRRLHCMV